MELIIVGGTQRTGIQEEWHQYEKAIILKFDTLSKIAENCASYISPHSVCPSENPSIIFKAGTIARNQLYVCTQTEILIYSLPDFHQTGYLSLPAFHDLHHVTPSAAGSLLVANTGLDMVIECTEHGEVLNEWNVLGGLPWERFCKQIDYRTMLSTKPHLSHPNYVFQLGSDVWATRCHQMDAVCLTNNQLKISIGGNMIHDGVVHGDFIYFTRVDGYVAVVSRHHLKVVGLYDLNKMSDAGVPLGWCRGIKVISREKVIIGFSRLRPTIRKDKEGIEIKHGNFGVMPTHITCFDLKYQRVEWEFEMESHGLNAIYSIHTQDK